jgi:hypothetical protein
LVDGVHRIRSQARFATDPIFITRHRPRLKSGRFAKPGDHAKEAAGVGDLGQPPALSAPLRLRLDQMKPPNAAGLGHAGLASWTSPAAALSPTKNDLSFSRMSVHANHACEIAANHLELATRDPEPGALSLDSSRLGLILL